MHILRQYWERLFSRLKKPFPSEGRHAPAPEELERARLEEHRVIAELEQVREAMRLARETDSRKLLDLDTRLAETDARHNQARERVALLENTLAETTARLEQAYGQIRDLQSSSLEQAKQFQDSLAESNERLESADNQVKVLGSRLDSEHRQVVKTFEELQGRFRKQDVRLNWTFTAAGFALLLGTVAGAVLIWDVQKNASMLAGMSQDIKDLMNAMDGKLGMQHSTQQQGQQLALPATQPRTRSTVTARPATGTVAQTLPEPAHSATISKSASNPFFLGSALDSGRTSNRLGARFPLRKDADAFFEENAKIDGMISLASGVQYRVVKAGNGKSPSLADSVVMAYIGSKPDGTVIDETYSSGQPASFSMGELAPGWREVLVKMEEGAEFELYVPPKLATSGGTRKRSMLGFEPMVYLIELQKVVKNGATDPPVPAK